MNIPAIQIGSVSTSRIILGGNPFSGFSHFDSETDSAMLRYYTVSRIKETLKEADKLGITTFLGRCDRHIVRMFMEYRNEGGAIQWFAQTCPEMKSIERSVEDAVTGGAKVCYIHGGVMDFLQAHDQLEEVFSAIEMIKNAGLASGIAGHNPKVFEWAEKNLDVEFYMCSYYNPAPRDKDAEYIQYKPDVFDDSDRDDMVKTIRGLSKPVIHYKIMAAGRNNPVEAFKYAASYIRPQDAVCVGVFTKDNPDMLADDVRMFLENLGKNNQNT